MAELRIWQKAFIESHLSSGQEPRVTQAVRLAFRNGYTFPEITAHTGWTEGQIAEAILSQLDRKPGEGG